MPRPRGRNLTACYDCHRQKVKCSGEQPCQRCSAREKECIYPKQEAIVPVPESYLQRLDRSLNELTDAIRTHGLDGSRVSAHPSQGHANDTGLRIEVPAVHTATDSLVEDSTAESFIRKLRETAGSASRFGPGDLDVALREHANLTLDTSLPSLSLQLPPYSDAVQLATRAEQEFGDYHTFLRKTFLNRFHATYRGHQSEAGDRNWLCRLSLVLALAESNTTTRQPIQLNLDGEAIETSPDDNHASSTEPNKSLSAGVELFEQGLALLKVAYETPTVDDVEALNLASHCCYILNRRKSAYAYAGQSIRLAHCLGLDRPAPASLSNLEREHRKRVWWTAFCVDCAISTELGLRPAYVSVGESLDYPSSSGLILEEKEEFHDPELLTAQIKLCQIKCAVVDTVSQLKSKDIAGPYEILSKCLQMLDRCGREMPEKVFSSCDSIPEGRICSSIALRYHQCYILLLRPVLLHQFTFMLRNETITTPSNELCTVNKICLHAARSNACIMIEVARSGKLVNYGYWDSAHLFSCLTVLAIANPMLKNQPGAFQCTEDDIARDTRTYHKARHVLAHMAHAGNIASKRHLTMLEEVERHGSVLSALTDTVSHTGDDIQMSETSNEIELGFEDWAGLMTMPDSTFSNFGPFA